MSEAGLHRFGHGDTTYTKIFVGGLAWETKRDALKRYFEQFGDIIEAVVINDKITGKSKGYGFVTYKDADSAMRACHNPFPMIDGRRANCNLAAFGVQKNRHASASRIMEKFSPPPPRVIAPLTTGTRAFYGQIVPHYAFPYPSYGYPGYTHNIYPLNHYNVYGGQQLASHYTIGTSGVYLSYFPLYPKYRASGTLTLPPPPSPSPSSVVATGAGVEEVAGMLGAASTQCSSV